MKSSTRPSKFLILVYQLAAGCRRLLYVGDSRKVKTLLRFFVRLGQERCRGIAATCSDLWKPYLKVLRKKAPAVLMVLDRFHIMQYLNYARDTIRRQETHELKRKGRMPLLENNRRYILKNKENQTEKQLARLSELLWHNLKTTRSYLLKVALLPARLPMPKRPRAGRP
ncbi:transposase [candidate division TA06 bacterium]|uniref:Transposase n=1 Tax=candidate division TA06 bacterium TaxID=2250710 RepID=A0A933MKF5_UNCT6|nr:transposase [candidate division TA06 bacterium]